MSDWKVWAQGERNPDNPVLFLDVDGVLNCDGDFRAGYSLCQRKVLMLNELPPCDIVVSSTWRIGTYAHLVSALHWLGCKKAVVGYTPELPYGSVRGDEIADWIARNCWPRFAIVDDDADMLPSQEPFFVQTSFDTGLTADHIARLSRILSPQPTT